MYQELLGSHFFTARNIITTWDNVLKTEFRQGEKVPSTVVETAKKEDFHNIALVSGGRPIGFIKTTVAEDTLMDDAQVVPISEWSMTANEPFPVVALKLARDASTFPMHFIIDQDDHVLGIATYADLNRRAAYLFTYALGSALEQWMKEKIIRTLDVSGSNPDYVRSVRGSPRTLDAKRRRISRHDEIHELAVREKESPLSLCFLEELLEIVRNEPSLSQIEALLPPTVNVFVERYRNRVSHPTKLLVSNLNPEQEVMSLAGIWRDMTRFVVEQGIGNEKNRSYIRVP